jgi:hypothetical protein
MPRIYAWNLSSSSRSPVGGSLAIKARSEFLELRRRYLERAMDHACGHKHELQPEVEPTSDGLRIVFAKERNLKLAVR